MPANPILAKMLDRLYASLTRGPGLNCRPHSSRHRIDVASLADFWDIPPRQVIADLLGGQRVARVAARVDMPDELARENPFRATAGEGQKRDSPEIAAWRRQKSLLLKLRHLSEEAKTYEQDTGVHALGLGYPLLSMPPGSSGGTRRILAPIAFVPISLEVNVGRRPGVEIGCLGEADELVIANPSLMVWVERETGKSAEGLFADEEGSDPWREIRELLAWVTRSLDLNELSIEGLADPATFELQGVPLSEELQGKPTILPAAVLGLFPVSNQGLLRDMRAMVDAPVLAGPVRSFIDVNASLDSPKDDGPEAGAAVEPRARTFRDRRMVALADPCQARTVELARSSPALVMHGPPGTGKSQTITNIIGDHLARDERVLFVCDKRTALDVVANRLEHIGLGSLCALVHDPQRDQRDLYLSIRARLDELPDRKIDERAEAQVEKIDAELQTLHDELTRCHDSLMKATDGGASFHELMGSWLSIDAGGAAVEDAAALRGATPTELDAVRRDVQVILERAGAVNYPANPWTAGAGVTLDAFLARPMDALRRSFASCVEDARAADVTADASIPPFDETSLSQQAKLRAELAEKLEAIGQGVDEAVRKRVAGTSAEDVRRLDRQLADAVGYRAIFQDGPLDVDLALTARTESIRMSELNTSIADLQHYGEVAAKWYGFVMFGVRSAATRVLKRFGLTRTIENSARLATFLTRYRARIVLTDLTEKLSSVGGEGAMLPDEQLGAMLKAYELTLGARVLADSNGELAERFNKALLDGEARALLGTGLRRSGPRAAALEKLESSMRGLELFDAVWLARTGQAFRGGKLAGELLTLLDRRIDDVESVLRVRHGLSALPSAFAKAVAGLVESGASGEAGVAALKRGVLEGEIGRRLAADPGLSHLDDQRLHNALSRYAELERKKMGLVSRAILARWTLRQRERLLVGTGSRLNTAGADMRRRLFVRGSRAMRLRQVIDVGGGVEGGDPLFDICPIWMASPETVAQIFPRAVMFDVVVFDEASQCRLEEALPVLLRAKRVVIAGDPKQLPPTRFFEAAVTTSEDDEIETDQDLFEMQQGEVEDLLGAALNIDVEEAYLDVHYRSRNADLIEFSNQQFYNSRLQAIPGHPSNRSRFAPLSLHRADGVYEDRANEVEARRVGQIVLDLLNTTVALVYLALVRGSDIFARSPDDVAATWTTSMHVHRRSGVAR